MAEIGPWAKWRRYGNNQKLKATSIAAKAGWNCTNVQMAAGSPEACRAALGADPPQGSGDAT
jgi:hypothetical protein